MSLEHRTYGLRLYFEGPELHFEADHCGPLSPELHFEADHCPEFRDRPVFRRSRRSISKTGLYSKVQTKPGLFEGLGRSISKAGLYLKSRPEYFESSFRRSMAFQTPSDGISKVYSFL
ncbi:hypothetical protein RCL_jg4346.t1 [Rhizophagus clarus]|uniref:Uncharacterized protein n=1 Tax=Rhizophagus clarus TaxID=94130 RepID=A0A8H3KTY3_9GLOM|nr:hypothetical protein RCL_jg4346.t1 [Rhizophagus clarus]